MKHHGSSSMRTLAALALATSLAPIAAASPHSRKQAPEKTDSAHFTIHPSDVTLAVNQKLTFGVTDANGKAVPVRWKISGVGCSTSTCGAIDSDGAYQAPTSVTRPLVVMLEGIPVDNSEFPAFARILIAPGVAPAPKTPSAPSASPAAPPAAVAAVESPGSTTVIAPQFAAQAQIRTQMQYSAAGIAQATVAPPVANATVPATDGSVVTYQKGQLTINATNETLANVLHQIAAKTGAIIDVPAGSGLEQIVEHAGPAPASDVIAQLLKGSHFNFVLIGSPQHPEELREVLLTLRGENEVAYTPPPAQPTQEIQPTPPETDPGSGIFTGSHPPLAGLSHEQLREMMKERAREIRDSAGQEAPPQGPQPQ